MQSPSSGFVVHVCLFSSTILNVVVTMLNGAFYECAKNNFPQCGPWHQRQWWVRTNTPGPQTVSGVLWFPVITSHLPPPVTQRRSLRMELWFSPALLILFNLGHQSPFPGLTRLIRWGCPQNIRDERRQPVHTFGGITSALVMPMSGPSYGSPPWALGLVHICLSESCKGGMHFLSS